MSSSWGTEDEQTVDAIRRAFKRAADWALYNYRIKENIERYAIACLSRDLDAMCAKGHLLHYVVRDVVVFSKEERKIFTSRSLPRGTVPGDPIVNDGELNGIVLSKSPDGLYYVMLQRPRPAIEALVVVNMPGPPRALHIDLSCSRELRSP